MSRPAAGAPVRSTWGGSGSGRRRGEVLLQSSSAKIGHGLLHRLGRTMWRWVTRRASRISRLNRFSIWKGHDRARLDHQDMGDGFLAPAPRRRGSAGPLQPDHRLVGVAGPLASPVLEDEVTGDPGALGLDF